MLPLVILQGPAKSGKDTVANFLVQDGGFVAVAQADPMKRLAMWGFGFTIEQLWGESRDLKEAIDHRFDSEDFWDDTQAIVARYIQSKWLDLVLPGQYTQAEQSFWRWFHWLKAEFGPGGKTPGLSPRLMLQALGTEWGRSFSVNMWSDLAIKTAKDLLMTPNLGYTPSKGLWTPTEADDKVPTPAGVVVTDGRFRNEIINVKAVGGIAIRIDNPEQMAPSTVGIAGHASEAEQFTIPAHFFDLIITNNKKNGLAALREKVQTFLADFKYVTVIP